MRSAWIGLLVFALQDNPKQAPRVIEKPEERGVGKEVRGFETSPLAGLLKDAKAVAVAFTAADCPVAKLYFPKLVRLEREYRDKGVKFALVYCNSVDKPKPAEVEFPVFHDVDGALSKLLDARRTTEVFVIDPARVLRYRGAIDDQYGIGYDRDAPTKTYLLDALGALLSGGKIGVLATEAPGCAIERDPKPAAAAPVTFHKDVEAVLQRRCQECHRPGEIAPFSLLKYEQARAAGRRMKEVVSQRRMPPWQADPKIGDWENSRRLSEDELNTIVKWIDAGCPEGDAKDAPPARKFSEGWTIGTPDAVFKMPRPVDVPAEGTIPYRYVQVKVDTKEDQWVQGMEVRAGAREVVHHILVFCEYPRGRRGDQPPIDGGLYYGYFGVLVPGERPTVYPDGMGKLLPAGATLVFQIHYTANGKPAKDQSQIGLVYSKVPVKNEVLTRGIVNAKIRIPAGAANHEEEATFTFRTDAKILSFLPHMHLRGKSFRYIAIYPDGKEEMLLDVPGYDFRWQNVYRFKEPKFVKHGTKIRVVAHYDNSAANPANPDPKDTVTWGNQSWEEMLIGYMDFIKVGE